ncbi:MAG: response regulator [Saccharospirillaceae bacterium]|nr:response regulator [Saccharospirillaceae bacterium]MCD8531064.1 response regulator [Saccharospirillaceae bacterium]
MQRNVLLVDDEAGIIQAIRRMLRAEPFHILEASSGDEALAILQRHDIELMITDYKMPGMDGLTLCQKTREVSPATYRLLLSGQVDYSALRRAWQQGDVHRFVAKPWDNLLLGMDIKEGLKQHDLLKNLQHISQSLQTEQAILLTDSNWIVRMASPLLCEALQCEEQDILGVNLFASALSSMPVTLETDVTRQVEQQQTWLGYFSLTGPLQLNLPAWMAITPLGNQFRLCSCNFVASEQSPQRDLKDELQRYSGEHHLQRLQLAADRAHTEPQLLVVAFPAETVHHKDLSSICYERLQAATDDLYEIYSPQPHTFLILLPASVSDEQIERLSQNIQQDFNEAVSFQGQPTRLQPTISIEQKPAGITHWDDWLRRRLGLPVSTNKEQVREISAAPVADQESASSQYAALPVFDQQGTLSALQAPPASRYDEAGWRSWFKAIGNTWQQHFDHELNIVMPAADQPAEAIRCFIKALADCRRTIPVQCRIILGEDCILSQDEEDLNWRAELRAQECQLFIANFGRSFLNPRQILSLPIQGVSLAPEFLIHMRNSKSLPQSRRLLQRIHDHGLIIYAPGMDNTEALASAHQSNVDWLSGAVLSRELNADQLQWFSPAAELG